MSDRMVSCVRLFAFRKDISMNNKDRKRQIAYEVLMILVSLALLTFILQTLADPAAHHPRHFCCSDPTAVSIRQSC